MNNQSVLAAAPDHIADASKMVRGEQASEVVPSRDDLIQCLLATRGQSEGITADAILSMLYATPQPVVQGEPVATIHVDGSFVHVEWRIPAPSRCAMDVYTAPQPTEQQPAPDVSALVEALERVMYCNEVKFLPEGVQQAVSDALAAHRKQGGVS